MTPKEKMIAVIAIINTSPKASILPNDKARGQIINLVREVIAPEFPASELQNLVEEYFTFKRALMPALATSFMKSMGKGF